MTTHQKDESVCCPPFDPAPWDKQTHEWNNKLFIQDSIRQFMHMPLPGQFGKVIGRMWKTAEDAGAAPDMKDFLLLSYDPSPWKSYMYLAVTKEVPGTQNVKLSGNYLTKVYDGPYSGIPKYIKDMLSYVQSLGKKVKKFYFYYTTCPKCARKYGHNYIVTFAEV